MKPGEYLLATGDIELNAGRRTVTLEIANSGDRPIQVGSHYHFFETNHALRFDRAAARGMRLDIPAGTAVRFEPGQRRDVRLVDYAGDRIVHGFRGEVNGGLERSGSKRSRSLPNPPPRSGGGKGGGAARATSAKKRGR